MLASDVDELICIACSGALHHEPVPKDPDAEILEGALRCQSCGATYAVRAGIPRFVDDLEGYNASWNYKWTAIDRGRGINHRIIDKDDPAYLIHDVYDRNSHGGLAFDAMRGGKVIDIGCGVGQYTIKSLQENGARKIVALDLTEGVDVLRSIVISRYPELLDRILFVQANIFSMPFRPGSFDYVYSFGVLHHTGRTEEAIRCAAGLVREGGEINIWIYAAPLYYMDTREPGRQHLSRLSPLLRLLHGRLTARVWQKLFSKLSSRQADTVLRIFGSGFWYRWCKVPVLGVVPKLIMSPPLHPFRDYRRINLFDAHVNMWAENWSEAEIFPVLRASNIVIKGISDWRLGFWGVKDKSFYVAPEPTETDL